MADKPRVVMDPSATFRRLVRSIGWRRRHAERRRLRHRSHGHRARGRQAVALTVDGLVERPFFELDYDARHRYRRPTSPRSSSASATRGTEVATRRVGNVVWRACACRTCSTRGRETRGALRVSRGPRLRLLRHVHSERYVKDLPLARALEPARAGGWAMNGEPLSAEHGFPARVSCRVLRHEQCEMAVASHADRRASEAVHHAALHRRVDGEMRPVRELDCHAVIVSRLRALFWKPAARDRRLGVERVAGERGGRQHRRRQDVAACARDPTRRWSSVAGVHLRVGTPRRPVGTKCTRARLTRRACPAGRGPQPHPYNQHRRGISEASWQRPGSA